MRIAVKEMPDVVRQALKSVGYGRKDIEVKAAEKAHAMQGGDGQRGFMSVVNLSTGEYRTAYGSWGGSNPFQTSVDDIDTVVLRPGMMVITGVSGYGPVYAIIEAHPSNLTAMLPAVPALTDREIKILRAFQSLKGGQYRQQYLRAAGINQSEIDALEAKGLIKINKAGAGQITTAGKNALPPGGGFYGMSGGAWSPPWSR